MSRRITIVAAALAGLVTGAVLTLAAQGAPRSEDGNGAGASPLVATTPQAPSTFLVWVPRGLPDTFARRVAALPKVAELTIVREDDAWLRRSWSATGEVVDRPAPGYAIPLDTAAVDPETFASFVPAADRPSVAALADGEAILGATSAELRGLGVGGVLSLGGQRLRVAAVLPDQLVGAAEVVVSRRTGALVGVTHPRYLLVRPDAGRRITASAFRARITPFLPDGLGIDRAVQVRAPGDTPYFRAGDAVLPPIVVKSLFGEFAARPGARPGTIDIDPAWVDAHIETDHLPVLGRASCNRAVVPQLRAAMRRVRAAGLAHTISSYEGCYVPRYIGWSDDNLLSYHAWGIAFDVNAGSNLRGETPQQDPRMVRILGRWGFAWGGTWIVPDGNHFEFHRMVPAG
jgi:D-alanyl-D-alanine carboxypeptidase